MQTDQFLLPLQMVVQRSVMILVVEKSVASITTRPRDTWYIGMHTSDVG
jgi:hypothetical protein